MGRLKRTQVMRVVDPLGIHGRPAAALAIAVARSGGRANVRVGERSADAASVIALLSLGARVGTDVTVEMDGDESAVAAIERALAEMFSPI